MLSRSAVIAASAALAIGLLYVRSRARRARHAEEAFVSALRVYPVKSCRGIDVPAAEITDTGFLNDRRWMVVDAKTHNFVSIRQIGSMTLLVPSFAGPNLEIRKADDPTVAALVVPLRFTDEQKKTLLTYDVTVWDDTVHGRDCGDNAAEWLTKVLGQSVRLVTFADDYTRPLEKEGYYLRYPAAGKIDAAVQPSFADVAPFLLASEASIDEVSRRANDDIVIDRFRPNIIVRGCRAFEEDTWSEIDVSGEQLFCVKPCARCNVPNVDPLTGLAGKQPTASMLTREFRRLGNYAFFGQHVVQARPGGTLRVGDRVNVRARFNEYRGPVAHDNFPVEPPPKPAQSAPSTAQ